MKKTKIKLPSEEIREIWEELKSLKRMQSFGNITPSRTRLENRYENIEILFGHESTLEKATIYYLDERFKNQQQIIQNSYVSSDEIRSETQEN